MSRFTTTLQVVTTVAFTAGMACLGISTATADPNSADVNTLAAFLSKGYSLSNCAPQPLSPGVLAQIACNQNADPSGPAGAQYFLYNSADGPATTLKGVLSGGNLTVTNCGDSQSPTSWQQGAARPDKSFVELCQDRGTQPKLRGPRTPRTL